MFNDTPARKTDRLLVFRAGVSLNIHSFIHSFLDFYLFNNKKERRKEETNSKQIFKYVRKTQCLTLPQHNC